MAGAGYKLFNTGDVLTAAQVNTYLMEQTVMVFADAAARTTALSGVVSEGMISYLKDTNAVEVYNGSAWVASDDPNAIQNTIVDAKGDLISASAADTPARLAVGNNGETLVADSSATTGLRWQGDFAAGKNKIINGDFGIWQRGTNFAGLTVGAYTADRWIGNLSGATVSYSQQSFTAGTAPVAGYEGTFFLRMEVTVADDNAGIMQRIEDVRTFANQTVTVSFWAKGDTARIVQPIFRQDFGTGGSTAVATLGTNISITTNWVRYSQTFTIPSISGKTIGASSYLELNLRNPNNETSTIDFWGVQLEAGNVATAFQTATGTLAGELVACQRYFVRYGGEATNAAIGNATFFSNTGGMGYLNFPVEMRIVPTSLTVSAAGDFSAELPGVAAQTLTSIGLSNRTSKKMLAFDVGYGSNANFTANKMGLIYTLNTNASLGVSAEL